MWYDKLNQISNIGDMVQNIDVSINERKSGLCLSLSETANEKPPFGLKLLRCDEKRSTICRVETPEKIPPKKPPSFPCIPKGPISRKKRGGNEATLPDNSNKEGKVQIR